jgi:hypothetical protein
MFKSVEKEQLCLGADNVWEKAASRPAFDI